MQCLLYAPSCMISFPNLRSSTTFKMQDILPEWKPPYFTMILQIPIQNLEFCSFKPVKNKKCSLSDFKIQWPLFPFTCFKQMVFSSFFGRYTLHLLTPYCWNDFKRFIVLYNLLERFVRLGSTLSPSTHLLSFNF